MLAVLPDLSPVPGVQAAAVLRPRNDGAISESDRRIRDHQRRIKLTRRTEAVTGWTGALRRVEREDSWLKCLQAALRVVRARHPVAPRRRLPVAVHIPDDVQRAAAGAKSGLDGVGQPIACLVASDNDAIDHGLHVVPLVPRDLERVLSAPGKDLANVDYVSVNACPHETCGLEVGQHVAVEPLAGANDRRAHHDAGAFWKLAEPLDNQRGARSFDWSSTGSLTLCRPACGVAASRKEQPEVVVNLGRRCDGRAGRVTRSSLLNGDGRWKPIDGFDLWLSRLLQKLPRVGGQ